MSDDSSPPPSDDDRLRISRRLLLSSPPGQFDLILSDLRNIHKHSSSSATELLNDKWVEGVQIEYESETRRNVLGDAKLGGGELAEAIREEMGKYMKTHYSSKSISGGANGSTGSTCRSNVSVAASDDGSSLSIVTYAERIDLRNYHAGSWSAQYKIRTIGAAEAEMEMTGAVDLVAHAFENGNVQMRSSIPLGPSAIPAKSDSPRDVAAAVASQILQWEDEHVQKKLGEMYDSVNDGMLKSLRRVMPLTRTRMDWKNVGGHRLVKTMAERKAELEG